MATKVSLTKVIDALEIATDEMSSFVSKQTGQIVILYPSELMEQTSRTGFVQIVEEAPTVGCAILDRGQIATLGWRYRPPFRAQARAAGCIVHVGVEPIF
jgi:hypothetical protein